MTLHNNLHFTHILYVQRKVSAAPFLFTLWRTHSNSVMIINACMRITATPITTTAAAASPTITKFDIVLRIEEEEEDGAHNVIKSSDVNQTKRMKLMSKNRESNKKESTHTYLSLAMERIDSSTSVTHHNIYLKAPMCGLRFCASQIILAGK